MADEVLTSRDGAVLTITFNRPEVYNAFNRELHAALHEALPLIAGSPGCLGVSVSKCLERPDTYLLLVQWESVEAHVVVFRGSPAFESWRGLLHHFYDPAPTVEHFQPVALLP